MIRNTFKLLLLTLATTLMSGVAYASNDYPDRMIRLIVTSGPGSGLDAVARTMSADLGQALGQAVVIENRPGAAGILGTREVLSATSDGYTLGLVSSNHAVNPSLHESLPYDSESDITAIAMLGAVPLVLAVPSHSPYKTVADLTKAMAENPEGINFGSSGLGSALHMATLLLEARTNTKVMHIPYKGGSALVTDLVSGQIDAAFLAIPTAAAQLAGGALRPLGVSTAERLSILPDVMTLSEAGVADYRFVPWIGLIGPAGMDQGVVDTLESTFIDVVTRESLGDKFSIQGFIPEGVPTEEFERFIKTDIIESAELIQRATATEPL